MLEASSGGGAVKVTVNGQQELQSIKISPEVVNAADVAMLEDLVLAAINEAMEKSQQLAHDRLRGLAGGLDIPGL